MKALKFIVPLIASLCIVGCSKKEETSTPAPKRTGRFFVPSTAAEVVASTDFKAEFTTKGGIQCYICPISQEIAKSIDLESPDHRFLHQGASSFFVVPVRDGNIVTLPSPDADELTEFLSKRTKK